MIRHRLCALLLVLSALTAFGRTLQGTAFRAALLLPLAITAVMPSAIAAGTGANAQDADGPLEAREGRLIDREAYEELRRQGPTANFDAAAARQRAMAQRINTLSAAAPLPESYQHAEAWVPVGPAPLIGGQTPTQPIIPSPVSGRISAIAIDAQDSVVFAGGAQGGVWRSDNSGATWQALTDNLGSLAVGAIVIAPGTHARNQATLYLGTGEGNGSGDSYAGVGIYKSTDSGHTWQGPFGVAQFQGRSVASIAVDNTNALNILAGSMTTAYGIGGFGAGGAVGLYRSTDGGASWVEVFHNAGSTQPISYLLQDPNVSTRFWAAMFAAATADHGLLVSDDSGATWTAVDDGVGGHPPHINIANSYGFARTYISAMNNAGTTVLYYGTSEVPTSQSTTGYGGTLYVSTDGGTTFTYESSADGFCQNQCYYDMPILVEPTDASIVYTGGAGASKTSDGTNTGTELTPSLFMRSNDGGATFISHVRSADQTTALHADMHAITAWPGHANEIWSGNDGGIWQSIDGGDNWINHNTTIQVTQFQGCDLDPTDPNRAYGGTQDNGTNGWTGSVGWPHLDFGDGGFALIDQGHPNNLVHTYYNVSSYQTGVAFTTAGFATTQGSYFFSFAAFNPATGNGIAFNDRVLFYAPLHLDRGQTDTLYFGTNRLWKADAFFSQTVSGGGRGQAGIFSALGPSPGQDLTGGTIGAPGSQAISAIETIANPAPGLDAQIIFTGSLNGHVFRSTDSGASFTEVDAFPAHIALFVSAVLVNPRNEQIVFQSRAGFTGALPAHNIRKSTDGGATWADSSNGLPDIPVNALAYDPVAPNTMWAGTDVGVYLSSDGGATWNPYGNGLPNVAIFDLKANHATNSIIACTHGRGAFRLSLDAIFIDGFDGD